MQNFYTKLSVKEKKIFYITSIFVLVAVFDRLFLGKVLERINAIEEKIHQQETSIIRDLRFLSYKDRIIRESQYFKKYFIDEIEDSDVINAEFLGELEKLASASNVNLTKSTPADINTQKKYTEYYADLDCVGKLEDMIAFMHAINTNDDLLKVSKFNMTSKRGADNQVNASMLIVKLIMHPYKPDILAP